MLTLYHTKMSVCSVKARLALAEKGVAWDERLMTGRGDQYDPEYMKLNPNAVVPTLVHDGKVILESTVIMHYVDECFPGPPLLPSDPLARSKVRMTAKLMDENVHYGCVGLTFATVNRNNFAKMSVEQFEAELRKREDPKFSDIKRQVVRYGLDAPVVVESVRQFVMLLDRIEAAMQDGDFIAGASYSLADAAATPYVWRLDMLSLGRMWEHRPGVARWYDRMRNRPSFKTAVEGWVTPADRERYANAPDAWPKVREILRAE